MHEKLFHFQRSQAGFSLIELLVVVTIILTLTGLGLAGYNNFNQRQILRQAAEGVKNSLRDAQNRALTGEKGSICTGILDYWRFSINATTRTSYYITGRCAGSDFGQKNFNLPPNLTFRAAVNIDFKPLAQGTKSNATVTITIDQSTTGNSINITVSPSGEIKLQ